jgi:hypothetical protein
VIPEHPAVPVAQRFRQRGIVPHIVSWRRRRNTTKQEKRNEYSTYRYSEHALQITTGNWHNAEVILSARYLRLVWQSGEYGQ